MGPHDAQAVKGGGNAETEMAKAREPTTPISTEELDLIQFGRIFHKRPRKN